MPSLRISGPFLTSGTNRFGHLAHFAHGICRSLQTSRLDSLDFMGKLTEQIVLARRLSIGSLCKRRTSGSASSVEYPPAESIEHGAWIAGRLESVHARLNGVHQMTSKRLCRMRGWRIVEEGILFIMFEPFTLSWP